MLRHRPVKYRCMDASLNKSHMKVLVKRKALLFSLSRHCSAGSLGNEPKLKKELASAGGNSASAAVQGSVATSTTSSSFPRNQEEMISLLADGWCLLQRPRLFLAQWRLCSFQKPHFLPPILDPLNHDQHRGCFRLTQCLGTDQVTECKSSVLTGQRQAVKLLLLTLKGLGRKS